MKNSLSRCEQTLYNQLFKRHERVRWEDLAKHDLQTLRRLVDKGYVRCSDLNARGRQRYATYFEKIDDVEVATETQGA